MSNKVTYLNLKSCLDGNKIVLFGASLNAAECIGIINGSIPIAYICDNDKTKHGETLFGIRIESPDKLKHEDKDCLVVIITSSCYAAIVPQLLELGVKNIKYHSSLIDFTNKKVNIRPNIQHYDHSDNPPHIYIDVDDKEAVNGLLRLFNVIEDESYSKELLKFVIKNRISNKKSDMNPDFQVKDPYFYFSTKLFSKSYENEIIINCGPEKGEDFRHFYKIFGNRLKKVYAFEPGNKEFNQTSMDLNYIDVLDGKDLSQKNIKEIVDIKLYPYALSDKSETLYYSKIFQCTLDKSHNGYAVEAKTIDEIVDASDKITLIAMNIEGAELPSLKGAEKTILKDRPRLMICAYHKSKDLWEIPLYIKALCPEYKLYFRPHEGFARVLEMHAICD